MKKKCFIISIMFIFLVLAISLKTEIYAFDINSQLGNNLSAYATIQGQSTSFDKKVETVVGVLSVGGTIIAVATLIIIGIRYMTGSIEEKAEYRKTLKPYLIGAFMVFAITNLLGILYVVASEGFNS